MPQRRDGKPHIRPTASEQARLIEIIARLYRQGYTTRTIAAALDIGPTTTVNYLAKTGLVGDKSPQPRHLPDLEPINWRDQVRPDPEVTVDYHLSLPSRSTRETLRYLREINGVVRFAYDVNEALEAGDQAWVDARRGDLAELMEYLRRMVAVVDDPEARARARTDHNERDDLRPRLRRVAG